MASVAQIFINLEKLIQKESNRDYSTLPKSSDELLKLLTDILESIFKEIDSLSDILRDDDKILISVKQQKALRLSFQLVVALGVLPCLIEGVGIPLSKRCLTTIVVPHLPLNDIEKYEILILCIEFFTRSYVVPVLRSIIITYHLCDYLAMLIQLSFAPLKKPGIYKNFTMTPEIYKELLLHRQAFLSTYNQLVVNCFQPTLMKELLVLSGTDPPPPAFVKRVIAQEMSRRLLGPGGLLSLIRCFMECYEISKNSDYQWMKTDLICKLVVFKHGPISVEDYLSNICLQVTQILSLNSTHYLAPAAACAVSLVEKYPEQQSVKEMTVEIFQSFDYNTLNKKAKLPGTLIWSSQEVENRINILDASANMDSEFVLSIIMKNIPVLVEVAFTIDKKNEALKEKVSNIIMKCLEACTPSLVLDLIKKIMFGERNENPNIKVESYETGAAIKYQECTDEYPIEAGMSCFLHVFNSSQNVELAQKVFNAYLQLFTELSEKRSCKHKKESEDFFLLQSQYACTLQVLAEISTEKKVQSQLKRESSSLLKFIEYFLVKYSVTAEDDCLSICLVLLTTILPEATMEVKKRCKALIPILEKVAQDDTHYNAILCKEAINMIKSNETRAKESDFEKAITDVLDSCLPVRAHGIIELTKLIDAKDPETIAKKHYLFCLFQEHLKDEDSYIYLSAVNGLAALGAYCPEDVLQQLCKEFRDRGTEQLTADEQNTDAEMRMKVGDVIVKVTKGLGEMAVVHKATLLNTMLLVCRDHDPLVRASAFSNLAEIARVMHYKMGSIIYEVLICIWKTIENDKAVECRRAAVMVLSNLLKGLGVQTLLELKDELLPIYRSLKIIYTNDNEDQVVRLHAQIALEELNDSTRQIMFPEVKLEKKIIVLN